MRDPRSTKDELLQQKGQFVDGGISTANNPSLQLLKTALMNGFAFGWKTGPENLVLVSVGTGLKRRNRGYARGFAATAAPFALAALASIMDDCNREVETLMQWFSLSPTARHIDGQIQSLAGEMLTPRPLLNYLRYNVQFDQDWMKEQLPALASDYSQQRLDRLEPMDQPRNMDELAKLAAAAADAQVLDSHFPAAFDI